ncbi:MAG: hypothetical protein ACR2QC_00700 [Gammaproteobacteria bacterium]
MAGICIMAAVAAWPFAVVAFVVNAGSLIVRTAALLAVFALSAAGAFFIADAGEYWATLILVSVAWMSVFFCVIDLAMAHGAWYARHQYDKKAAANAVAQSPSQP